MTPGASAAARKKHLIHVLPSFGPRPREREGHLSSGNLPFRGMLSEVVTHAHRMGRPPNRLPHSEAIQNGHTSRHQSFRRRASPWEAVALEEFHLQAHVVQGGSQSAETRNGRQPEIKTSAIVLSKIAIA